MITNTSSIEIQADFESGHLVFSSYCGKAEKILLVIPKILKIIYPKQMMLSLYSNHEMLSDFKEKKKIIKLEKDDDDKYDVCGYWFRVYIENQKNPEDFYYFTMKAALQDYISLETLIEAFYDKRNITHKLPFPS